MLSRLAIRPFGSIWKLQNSCQNSSGILGKIQRFIYGWYQFEHGSKIDFKADIGTGVVVPFGVRQIVINPDVKIGKNCVINPWVMITEDNTFEGRDKASPIIGDNCFLGAGVKIIGAVKIGNNVKILANCVVMQDVPDNSVVSMPAPSIKVVKEKIDTKHYEKRMRELYYFEGAKLIKVDK